MSQILTKINPIHPFPARMAPELVWEEIPKRKRGLTILDPMMGSGTTLVAAKLTNNFAIGFDRDPLAIMMSRSWVTNLNKNKVLEVTSQIVREARLTARNITLGSAYPENSDSETNRFVRYWFDDTNRIHLTALSRTIYKVNNRYLRNIMWCAFSRLIITKVNGVSLAMDTSHSRPHRVYDLAPRLALDDFQNAVNKILKISPFVDQKNKYLRATAKYGDARKIPLRSNTVDVIITSPPYLNAIDYIRGHRLALVWMGNNVKKLRSIRGTNVGSETAINNFKYLNDIEHIIKYMCDPNKLKNRQKEMLRKYIVDMRCVLKEIHRVMKKKAKAVIVIGNCNVNNTFVKNSNCIEWLANDLNLYINEIKRRPIKENKRYLPPPKNSGNESTLNKRMREEVIISLAKF